MIRTAPHLVCWTLTAAFILWALPPCSIAAKETREARPIENKKKHDELTVAVLDFNASSASNKEMGPQITELLSATLSGLEGITLVDRSTLSRALEEHELTLTGIANTDQAIQVGKLVGAKILITGKVFVQGPDLYITAKLIGTETSLLDGLYVKAEKDADAGALLMKLSEKIVVRLREAGPKLVAREDLAPDPLLELKKLLANRILPRIAIHANEQHIPAAQSIAADPAVQTELTKILTDGGFAVIDVDEKQEADSGVGITIYADGLSEFAARIGSLVNCSARVEVKMTDRKSKEVIFSAEATARAVDLSEALAGKTALQKAAHLLGIEILRRMDATLPPAKDSASKPPRREKVKRADD